jgi:cell division protease FtsH
MTNNKNTKKNQFQGGPRNLIVGVVLLVGFILLLAQLTDYTRQTKVINYSEFISQVEKNAVKSVFVNGQEVKGKFTDGTHFEATIVQDAKIWDLLKEHGVEFAVMNAANQLNIWYILGLISILGALALAAWFIFSQARNMGGGNNGGASNIFSMGKSRAKMFMPSTIKENFNSVAGATEAKEELKDLVDYLKNPEKFKRLGAKITRGVLLVGEPGNGKTLLAKAVAGEANCPFFSISGSDFIEVFVGIGAARVRDLFAQARKNSPSIIFIDEIDAVGRTRGSGLGGGHDEREQTLNQLLTEMDGFQTTGGAVIVLAATNRADVLDKALLRPGRFDRRVEVPFPDLTSREQILRLHAKTVKIDPAVDLAKIARGTPGFSGADLANLINEAALMASKHDQDSVTIHDFEEARDKVIVGKELKTIIMSEDEKRLTAYHEAGHALMLLTQPVDAEPLHKVTIIPRGRALGITWWLPERDKYQKTKRETLAAIKVGMGGRAAEDIVFGDKNITSGCYGDFVTATQLARNMVCLWGMSEKLGPVVYNTSAHGSDYSSQTAARIDEEVRKILEDCYNQAKEILINNREKLEKLALALLEKETLHAAEIYALLEITPRIEHSFK